MKNKKSIWYWILNILFYRCPKCGSKTIEQGYGEFCTNEKCNWMYGE